LQRRERLKRERKAGKRTTAGAALSADAEAAEQEAERAWQAEEEAAAEQARHDELQKLQASSRLLRIRFWPSVRPWPHARAFAKRSLRIAERPLPFACGPFAVHRAVVRLGAGSCVLQSICRQWCADEAVGR
jgi:post-segregation antitoxin (ccd killing protein)